MEIYKKDGDESEMMEFFFDFVTEKCSTYRALTDPILGFLESGHSKLSSPTGLNFWSSLYQEIKISINFVFYNHFRNNSIFFTLVQ